MPTRRWLSWRQAPTPTLATVRGCSARLYLARCYSAMKTLLSFGVDLADRKSIGCIALHWAGGGGKLEVVDALVEARADLESGFFQVRYFDWELDFERFTPSSAETLEPRVGESVASAGAKMLYY